MGSVAFVGFLVDVSLSDILVTDWEVACSYQHPGHVVHFNLGGQLVGLPTSYETTRSFNVQAHLIRNYEKNLEQYLADRRAWLWRKAIFIVRIVVIFNRLRLETRKKRTTDPRVSRLSAIAGENEMIDLDMHVVV